MKLEIIVPIFKCSDDESIFFSRLYSLPGYDSIAGSGRNIELSLKNTSEHQIQIQLKEICDIWNTTYKIK